MKHFSDYLQKQTFYLPTTTDLSPVGLIVVIPCFNEPDISETFRSLQKCTLPDCNVEIIAVVNSPEYATKEQLLENERTSAFIQQFQSELPPGMNVSTISISGIRKKDAGAGFARKVGMDEAVRRFMSLNEKRGIIVSLDADCLVAENYLTEIYRIFRSNPRLNVAVIQFEHILPNKESDAVMHRAGFLYELFLRYYSSALKYIGFPYYYHTIGSCFAVTGDAYIKVGGMNKKQAGEDFYFLHKLFPRGHIAEIKTTTVYPSARISDRVVFGTGPAIRKIAEDKEVSCKTFSFEAFCDLKMMFDSMDELFKADDETIRTWYSKLPPSVQDFLHTENYIPAIREISDNCASPVNFKKRFFGWFNAFMILKFMHFTHPAYYETDDVETQAEKLFLKRQFLGSVIN